MKISSFQVFKKSVVALAVISTLQANAEETAPQAIYPSHNASTEEGVTQAVVSEDSQIGLEQMRVTGDFQQSLVDRIPIAPQELPFTLNVLDRALLDQRNFTRPI